ncbi:aspartate-semialdehyde dehydrogenase [Candidatus Uhrbacteria bacterium]|nr:aspartate-semialdehyde dehydrogenase [Candidatus Uhrbacteria bacterium]
MKKFRVGILGATGMVGQRFVSLLAHHPWFDVVVLAASPRSAGQEYRVAVEGRWMMTTPIPEAMAALTVLRVEEDIDAITSQVQLVFCALDLEKEKIKEIEEAYASRGIVVVSNNSAHRWTPDIPMLIPEVNGEHLELIHAQRKARGWTRGCIVVKPNCSLQSFVPVLHALRQYGIARVLVSTYQALSGAGKTLASWPEMQDNVIPFIGGEEEKTEKEPLKIWGRIVGDHVEPATTPLISATCVRVPVSDGHLATVSVSFAKKVTSDEIIAAWRQFSNPLTALKLPFAPEPFITYFSEDNRPQTNLDRMIGNGMGIAIGRLRPDPLFDWKFVALSHNTIRGAAGGAILIAELLVAKEYIHRPLSS